MKRPFPALRRPGVLLAGAAAIALCLGATPFLRRAGDPRHITLRPTGRATGAGGRVEMSFAASPFGVAVTRDGNVRYQLAVTTTGLLEPATMGARHYIAWVASPQLDRFQPLGRLSPEGAVTGGTSMNKFLVLVTAETGEPGEKPGGPIVLRGRSPSGRLRSFQGEEIFNGPVPCCE